MAAQPNGQLRAAQQSRRFLAAAFRNDVYDRKETTKRSPVYEVTPSTAFSGTDHRHVVALQYSLFRPMKPTVFRLPLRRDRDDANFTEPFFFSADAEDHLVVEAIRETDDGEETCIAVASLPLTSARAGATNLQFRRGSAAMKFILNEGQPDKGDWVVTLPIEVQVLNTALRTHPADYYYPHTCIPISEFDPKEKVNNCKVVVRDLELNLSRVPEAEGSFETKVLFHNGYRELEVFVKPTPLGSYKTANGDLLKPCFHDRSSPDITCHILRVDVGRTP